MRPRAVGYLRRDISGARQQWDEIQIRSIAATFGYSLLKIVVFSDRTIRPIAKLSAVIEATGAAAVIIPSMWHFEGGGIPEELAAVADVVTADGHAKFGRTPPAS